MYRNNIFRFYCGYYFFQSFNISMSTRVNVMKRESPGLEIFQEFLCSKFDFVALPHGINEVAAVNSGNMLKIWLRRRSHKDHISVRLTADLVFPDLIVSHLNYNL